MSNPEQELKLTYAFKQDSNLISIGLTDCQALVT